MASSSRPKAALRSLMSRRIVASIIARPRRNLVDAGFHAERTYSRARFLVTQHGKKGLDCRSLAPRVDNEKIVVLRRHGQEAKAIELRHRFDREAPIGASLSDRSGDRVVRLR